MIQQKSEIKAGLESSFQKMVQFIESLDKHDLRTIRMESGRRDNNLNTLLKV
jgi:hypothetical protein